MCELNVLKGKNYNTQIKQTLKQKQKRNIKTNNPKQCIKHIIKFTETIYLNETAYLPMIILTIVSNCSVYFSCYQSILD